MEKPHVLRQVLDDHWLEVAAFAWCSYEQVGRGAIYLGLEALHMMPDVTSLPRLEYLVPSARLSAIADRLDPIHGRNIVTTLVVRYDPEKALVCITRESNGTVYARERSDPLFTPPEAAGRQES